MNKSKDEIRTKTLALNLLKQLTPVSTGHLRHHATFARDKTSGFDLVVSKGIAYYVVYVQEGRGYNANNRNYIGYAEKSIVGMIAQMAAMGKRASTLYNSLDKSISKDKANRKDTRVAKMNAINRRRGYVGKK